jgi:hypothetical protein
MKIFIVCVTVTGIQQYRYPNACLRATVKEVSSVLHRNTAYSVRPLVYDSKVTIVSALSLMYNKVN